MSEISHSPPPHTQLLLSRHSPPRLPSKTHRFRIAAIYPFSLIPSFHPQAQFILSFPRPSSIDSPFDFYVKGTTWTKLCSYSPAFVLRTPNKVAPKTSETQILPEMWERQRRAQDE